jgi:NAD(P)-dependent dehydrogenase (short-subunit alcohol dehydrogenase family)
MSTVLVVGATQGTGRALAAEYARRGATVVITGRSAERAEKVAAEVAAETQGAVSGLALDLSVPAGIAESLGSVPSLDRLALVGMVRDMNTTAAYDIGRATALATTKIVGYTAVVAAVAPQLRDGASVLFFGGISKDVPYPGSTTLTAVNSAVNGLVRTLSVELAPVRVNSIHPGAIVDTPFLLANEQAKTVAQRMSLAAQLGPMRDIVDGCLFLLENPIANGINLSLDGGRR